MNLFSSNLIPHRKCGKERSYQTLHTTNVREKGHRKSGKSYVPGFSNLLFLNPKTRWRLTTHNRAIITELSHSYLYIQDGKCLISRISTVQRSVAGLHRPLKHISIYLFKKTTENTTEVLSLVSTVCHK